MPQSPTHHDAKCSWNIRRGAATRACTPSVFNEGVGSTTEVPPHTHPTTPHPTRCSSNTRRAAATRACSLSVFYESLGCTSEVPPASHPATPYSRSTELLLT